jgi:fumarylacetoacetase
MNSGGGINETHDSGLRSWVAGAHDAKTDFPLQNLPLGVFRRRATREWRLGTRLGETIVDIAAMCSLELLPDAGSDARLLSAPTLNPLMAAGQSAWQRLRASLSLALRDAGIAAERARAHSSDILVPVVDAELRIAADIGDYTDFYASIHHATNVGAMFRPDNPLLPNYRWVPIGYHGRASSIVISGTPVRRPRGQTAPATGSDRPQFGPTGRLDYEAELGFFVGSANTLGARIPIETAPMHLFGACLLNDWSARDIQAWEYQPLGPFLAKNFASTLSPWIITWEALAPFRTAAMQRAEGDPAPLPYLFSAEDQRSGALNVDVTVELRSAGMRQRGEPPARLSQSNAAGLYWTPAQMLTHHASNGCNLRPGDLLGSGTISGASKESQGCLLELTNRGALPVQLPGNETRAFLEDGDEVVMRARCTAPGFVTIGFGECRGIIDPAGEP